MSTTIHLSIAEGQWVARWSGAERAEIVRLFGTDTIPTPFTARMDGLSVQRKIAKRNPECEVTR